MMMSQNLVAMLEEMNAALAAAQAAVTAAESALDTVESRLDTHDSQLSTLEGYTVNTRLAVLEAQTPTADFLHEAAQWSSEPAAIAAAAPGDITWLVWNGMAMNAISHSTLYTYTSDSDIELRENEDPVGENYAVFDIDMDGSASSDTASRGASLGQVDLTDIDYVYIDIEQTNAGVWDTLNARIGVLTDIDPGNYSSMPTFTVSQNLSVTGGGQPSLARQVLALDVSALTGTYHVGVAAQLNDNDDTHIYNLVKMYTVALL